MTLGTRPWTTESTARHPAARRGSTSRRLPGLARFAIVLEILLGIGAVGGGSLFILAPDGHLLGLPLKMLAGTPFHSFLLPGLLLFTFVGIGPIVAAAVTPRQRAIGPLAAMAVGVTLMTWIIVEMVLFAGSASLLWAFYLILGTVIAAVGAAWRRSTGARNGTGPGGDL